MEYTDRYKAFCKRMSIYRKLMDYDQAKMAVRVGMTTPEYSNREAGRSMVSGIDLRKFSDSGADIDKMLVDVDEKPCRYVISSEIETFGEESKKEYVRGVVSEHILYMCEKKIADFSDDTVKYIRLLKSIDKDSTKDSMLKCIRDVNGITDQQVISDNLGISRFKYSKIENNKELPDAMVLIRLYDLYGYVPSMYLNLYDVRGRLLDYIFDSMSQKDQEIIMNFINNLKERIINIGPRLKQRRKEMRIKQTEMAKELGVSQTYLSNIEGGRTNCSITLFVDICNYLNVTPDYLMLGNMRGNRASIDIIDELKMCSSEEIATVKKIVDAFVLKKTEPY